MPITVTCDECTEVHRVRDNAAGRRFSCRACGKKLLVVAPCGSPQRANTNHENGDGSSDGPAEDDLREFARQLAGTKSPAAPVQELPSFGKRLIGFAFNVLLVVLLGYFAILVASLFREAWWSNSWPSVMGTVKSSSVQRTGVGKNARVVAIVTYRYEVNAASHTGHRICVDGYTAKIFESAQAVSDRYVVDQPVKVFYNPANPASAVLLPGTTPGMWWPVFMLAVFGSSVGYSTYASFRSLIGKPLPKRTQDSNGRSFGQRAMGLFAASMIVLMAGMSIVGLGLVASHNWHIPHGLGEWFGLVLNLFLLAILLGMAWFACFAVYCSFKPVAIASDLRSEPGVPRYSDDSLVCVTGIRGHVAAVIVDDQAGMIHFRRSFAPGGFWVIKALPWFSCPLSSVTSVSQMSYKGITTLTIHTDAGKGSITSHASSFEELRRRFPQMKTAFAPGTAPLTGTQAVMVVAGIFGIFGGMVLSISSFLLGMLVLVGGIVLLVSSILVAPEN